MREREIKELYKEWLNRDPDPDGFNFYMGSNKSIKEIRSDITASRERKSIIKIKIISAYTKNEPYMSMSDMTFPFIENYCVKRGFDCERYDLTESEREPVFMKIPLILGDLKKYDYVVWVDSDAIIINTEFDVRDLVSSGRDLYISKDFYGVNAGVMVWRKCGFSENMLNRIWNSYNQYRNHVWKEKKALIDLLDSNYLSTKENVEYVPQKKLNAYDYSLYGVKHPIGQYDSKSFLIHFPGLPNRIKTISKYLDDFKNKGIIEYPLKYYPSSEEDFRKYCSELIPLLSKKFPEIDPLSKRKSLLIETRNLVHNEFVIKNSIQKLGDGWGHIIYCHRNNHEQIKSICDQINPGIEIRLLEKDLNINEYNNLLLNLDFWNEIDCEHVLIYQTDTFINTSFNESFLEWDYIGAKWCGKNSIKMGEIYSESSGDRVDRLDIGNGGLSLRRKDMMVKALSDTKFRDRIYGIKWRKELDGPPEDVYFSVYIKKHGKFPLDTSEFSIEFTECNNSIPSKLPFGFHKLHEGKNFVNFLRSYGKKLAKERLEEKCDTYIFVHDQNIIIDFIRNGKFSELDNLKYVFLGNREIDKIQDLKNVIISRNLPIQIESYPNLTSFTGWYALWKNDLINSEYVNLFEYDINLTDTFARNVYEKISENSNIIGYIPFETSDPAFIDNPKWSLELIQSIFEKYGIDARKKIKSLPKNYGCSITSNHTFRRDIFEDYMRWIEPMIDDIKISFFSGQQAERSIMIYYILNRIKVDMITDVLSHFQFDTHRTQDISALKKIENYNKLFDLEKIMDNFDWRTYLLKNMDLLPEIEINETSAIKHFTEHGFLENRPYYFTNITESIKNIDKKDKIILFYHIFCENDWKTIFTEQSRMIVDSGLFNHIDNIYINVIGTERDRIYLESSEIAEKSVILNIDNDFEFPTFKLMIERSKEEEFIGIYIHSKSSSYSINHKRKKPANLWRNFMNFHIIDEWRSCYNLAQKYEIVGTMYKKGNCEIDTYWKECSTSNMNNVFTDHFSGNFFWFRSSYMKNISFSNDEMKNRFNAEFLPFRKSPNFFEVFFNQEFWKYKIESYKNDRY
jgi:hypothetical protein